MSQYCGSAHFIPLYKADDKQEVENYLPISVLSSLSRVIERVVYGQLSVQLDKLGFMYQQQYGFRCGRNTEQAIAKLNNLVLESLDKGKVTGLSFIDVSKAFDSLNHRVLQGKLEHLGLSGNPLKWFRSYLGARQQSVFINGELSESKSITLGVPQGSTLGPRLFNVYINSLASVVERSKVMYADDAVRLCDASTPERLRDVLG